MARASVSPGTSRDQTTDAPRGVGDDPHTRTPAPSEVPLENVDILGDFGDGHYIAGNATLAELLGRTFDDSDTPEARAADALEMDQLHELACPAADLAGAALKVAWLLRMDFYGRDDSAYGSATTLLLRQAEVTRREILAKAAAR